jgi:flagellar hook-basal body complex protein FliE
MPLPVGGIGSPFSVGKLVENAAPTKAGGGGGFGKALSGALDSLGQSQAVADQQAQALATGQATDMASVVASVEKASLEVQLATQIRTKATEAFNQIMQMQV